MVFGDAHALQYFPALRALARRRAWRLVSVTKAHCPVADASVFSHTLGRRYWECALWREEALRLIERERPRLVIAGSASSYAVMAGMQLRSAGASASHLRAGWERTLARLLATGSQVVAIEDTPRPPAPIPGCVLGSRKHLSRCAFPRETGLAFPRLAARAARRVGGVLLLDPSPKLCLPDVCPAVIGNVLVYRSDGALTATYARTMARWLERRLRSSGL
jgi:hypothetical protein